MYHIYVYVYIYACMLSLRCPKTSVYAIGEISRMVGDDQRVDDRVRSCTVGIDSPIGLAER